MGSFFVCNVLICVCVCTCVGNKQFANVMPFIILVLFPFWISIEKLVRSKFMFKFSVDIGLYHIIYRHEILIEFLYSVIYINWNFYLFQSKKKKPTFYTISNWTQEQPFCTYRTKKVKTNYKNCYLFSTIFLI